MRALDLDNKHGEGYDGMDGNDDAGTLSAWYIFSALGFYPHAGSDKYQFGAPLFEEVRMKLGNNSLTITLPFVDPAGCGTPRLIVIDVRLMTGKHKPRTDRGRHGTVCAADGTPDHFV